MTTSDTQRSGGSATTLAVDIGGSSTKVALVDDGSIVVSNRLPHTDGSVGLDALADACDTTLASVPGVDLSGVGVAVPGIVDAAGTTMTSAHDKCPDLVGVDLRRWATDRWSVGACVENDARAGLVGEVSSGVASDSRNVVYMTLGTGIGTAAMIDGQLLRGVHGHAGMLGGPLLRHATVTSW